MKKKILISCCICIVVIIFLIILLRLYSKSSKYDEEFIIGNNISIIVEEYGEFDKVFYDGSGMLVSGWYTLNEREPALVGVKEAKYLIINFENGIAVKVYERVGNIGG